MPRELITAPTTMPTTVPTTVLVPVTMVMAVACAAVRGLARPCTALRVAPCPACCGRDGNLPWPSPLPPGRCLCSRPFLSAPFSRHRLSVYLSNTTAATASACFRWSAVRTVPRASLPTVVPRTCLVSRFFVFCADFITKLSAHRGVFRYVVSAPWKQCNKRTGLDVPLPSSAPPRILVSRVLGDHMSHCNGYRAHVASSGLGGQHGGGAWVCRRNRKRRDRHPPLY